ncbi:MAG: branched-chain amino acid ABC transporter permease [Actinomycetota bacterium]
MSLLLGSPRAVWLLAIPALAVGIVLGPLFPQQQLTLTDVFIAGLLVLSLVVLTGFTGQISLCQATFQGLGAFVAGNLVAYHGLSWWVAAPVAIAAAALLGVLVGLPALRLRGLQLAIVTLAVAVVFDNYVFYTPHFRWLTHAPEFVAGARRPTLLGLEFQNRPLRFYYLALAVFVLALLVVRNVRRGKTGRVLRALRDSEVASSVNGLDLTRYKLLAFGLSAAIAGASGALLAIRFDAGSVSPSPFDFVHSLNITAIAVLVGVNFIPAAVIGGILDRYFQVLATDVLHIAFDWVPLILAAALIAQIVLAPEGLWGALRHTYYSLLARGAPKILPAGSGAEGG